MRILFWGTPEFAVPSLRALSEEGFEIVGVVTQPDRPAGRGRRLTPSPIKRVALDEGLPTLTPERPRGEAFLAEIGALAPDLSVVVAYGHILRREVLDLPSGGSLNLHASLLPDLRGAAPIQWAIARGLAVTGVTVMRMVEAMDAGPIIHQAAEPILADETASELALRLSEVGAATLVEGLTLMARGGIEEKEQDEAAATYAPKVSRELARVDWTRGPREIARHVRAMDAVPGAWSTLDRTTVKLFRPVVDGEARDGPAYGGETTTAPADGDVVYAAGGKVVAGTRSGSVGGNGAATAASDPDARPGFVLATDPDRGILVGTGSGAVWFGDVQPAGSRRMSAAAWVRGRGVRVGQRFG